MAGGTEILGDVLVPAATNYFNGVGSLQVGMGRQGQLFVGEVHGKYYEQAIGGLMFSQAVTPLGLAIPIYTSVTPLGNVIWNTSANKNVVLTYVDLAYASGTAALASIGLMTRAGMGNAIATAAPFSAFASTTPKNALIGGGQASNVLSSNAGTVTLTTAGAATDWTRTIATINLEAATGTAHATQIAHYDFEGSVVLPPGSACWLAATVASVALYASSIAWYEVGIPA